AALDEHARAHRRHVRESLEQARDTVMATVRVHASLSNRVAQAVIRLEVADQLFGALIAFSELMAEGGIAGEARRMERLLGLLRLILIGLARVIVSDGRSTARIERLIALFATEVDQFPAGDAASRLGRVMLDRLRIALTLSTPAGCLPGTLKSGKRPPLWRRIIAPLRTNLSWESATMRHATRIGVVAVPAVSFSALWGTRYEYWLTITLVLTMQPFFSLTLARALERIGGTVLGGIVGAVIAALCQTPLAMLAAIFPLALFAVAIRQVSFGLFMMAVTPIVVLLSELEQASVSSWALAGTRALFTLAGGTLALAACLFLWPSWEPDRLRREA